MERSLKRLESESKYRRKQNSLVELRKPAFGFWKSNLNDFLKNEDWNSMETVENSKEVEQKLIELPHTSKSKVASPSSSLIRYNLFFRFHWR